MVDAVDALAAAQPDFPWADYDIEDQGDVDGDGNLFEPDGVVDHFVIIHAGADKAAAGGAEGTYSIWSHASNVDPATGGYAVPGAGVRVSNYTMQGEAAGVGVISHEYGHDLGLPDLYDTSGAAESDVDYWDLMSSGSHTTWSRPTRIPSAGWLTTAAFRTASPGRPGASGAMTGST